MDNTNQEPTDTPSTIPTAFQVSCDYSLHPECTHNLMAIQCNQYPNPSHNSALPQLLAHPNCEDLDPTETPSPVPTALQVPSDDTYNPRCAHNPMETQCKQSQSHILMKQHCTHNPSTSQVKKSNHTSPMALAYPPDPGEYDLARSAAPTTLVERDKPNLSSLVPPEGEMESSFSWTCPFKSPTSSTLCFGEPTLGKLKHMPKSSSVTNRVSVSHSSLVTKNGEHFYGENFIYDSPIRLTSLKLFRPDSKATTPKHISRIVYLKDSNLCGAPNLQEHPPKPPTFPPPLVGLKSVESNKPFEPGCLQSLNRATRKG